MEKTATALLALSVLLVLFGGVDLVFFRNNPILGGVASGSYWKGAMAFVSWSIALQLMSRRPAS